MLLLLLLLLQLQSDIVLAEQELTELQSVRVDYEEKLENCQTELTQAKKEQVSYNNNNTVYYNNPIIQDIVKDEYTCLYSRLEELKLQIVSSPEELNEV